MRLLALPALSGCLLGVEPPSSVAPPVSDQRAIDFGFDNDETCILYEDGWVRCHGYARAPDVRLVSMTSSTGLYAGLSTIGRPVFWGRGDDDSRARPPEGELFERLSVGSDHACGLRETGEAVCWGSNADGKADPPSTLFAEVFAGRNATCGLRSDGTLRCWGEAYIVDEAPGGAFTSVTVGGLDACAVRQSGALVCWGLVIYEPPGGSDYTDVVQSYSTWCALREGGGVACWGQDSDGESNPPDEGGFVELELEMGTSCGLDEGGDITCWGRDGGSRP